MCEKIVLVEEEEEKEKEEKKEKGKKKKKKKRKKKKEKEEKEKEKESHRLDWYIMQWGGTMGARGPRAGAGVNHWREVNYYSSTMRWLLWQHDLCQKTKWRRSQLSADNDHDNDRRDITTTIMITIMITFMI